MEITNDVCVSADMSPSILHRFQAFNSYRKKSLCLGQWIHYFSQDIYSSSFTK